MNDSQTPNMLTAFALGVHRQPHMAGATIHVLFADDTGLALGPLFKILGSRVTDYWCAPIEDE